MLALLTNIMPSRVKFKCIKIKQYTFNEIKRIVARDTLLIYPYFNEEFKVHTDASDFQLGAVISKKGKPIDFYSGTITGAQRGYIIT